MCGTNWVRWLVRIEIYLALAPFCVSPFHCEEDATIIRVPKSKFSCAIAWFRHIFHCATFCLKRSRTPRCSDWPKSAFMLGAQPNAKSERALFVCVSAAAKVSKPNIMSVCDFCQALGNKWFPTPEAEFSPWELVLQGNRRRWLLIMRRRKVNAHIGRKGWRLRNNINLTALARCFYRVRVASAPVFPGNRKVDTQLRAMPRWDK